MFTFLVVFNFWQVIEFIFLIILLRLSDRWAMAIGGFLYLLITLPLYFYKTRSLSRFLLRNPLNLGVIFKLISWLVSSSGVLLGLGIHYLIWGKLDNFIEYYILLGLTILSLLNAISEIIFFDQEYSYLDNNFNSIKQWQSEYGILKEFTKTLEYFKDDKDKIRSLGRTVFVDMTLTRLFHVLFTFGVLVYCLGNLNLIPFSNNYANVPDIWESLSYGFSFLKISEESDDIFTGQIWNFIKLIMSFIVFFWLVMFITLASDSVDSSSDRVTDILKEDYDKRIKDQVEQLINNMKTELDLTTSKDDIKEYLGKIKIIRALVDPPGDDIGKEYITIQNSLNRDIELINWKLRDQFDRRYLIPRMVLKANSLENIKLPAFIFQLDNSFGRIELIDNNDNIIDVVEYNKATITMDGSVTWN